MARPPSGIRERLLSAALDNFARIGVDAASLRTIAKDAGSSVGMITYHFDGKEGLFDAILDAHYEPFSDDFRALAAVHADPVERLRVLIIRVARSTIEERQIARICLREMSVQTPRLERLGERVRAGHVPVLLQALADGMARGQLRVAPPMSAALTLLSPIVFSHMLGLSELVGVDAVRVTEQTLELALNGLLHPDHRT